MKIWLGLALAGFLAAPASAQVRSGEPVLPVPSPDAKSKSTLQFARQKVAAGAVDTDAHRSEWTLTLRDEKGQPLVGKSVELPKIVAGGRGPKDGEPPAAKLSWKNGPKAKTDAKGQIVGIFRSGNRTEVTMIEHSGARASVEQVWNEIEDAFESEQIGESDSYVITYRMTFAENGVQVPITGHKMHLEPTEVEFYVTDPRLGPDEDGDGRPDGESREISVKASEPDNPLWKAFLSWSKWNFPVVEIEPGVYKTEYYLNIPRDAEDNGPTIDGLVIEGVGEVSYDIVDEVSFGPKGDIDP